MPTLGHGIKNISKVLKHVYELYTWALSLFPSYEFSDKLLVNILWQSIGPKWFNGLFPNSVNALKRLWTQTFGNLLIDHVFVKVHEYKIGFFLAVFSL